MYFRDIKASKESKHVFEKTASELDAALLRNSQVLKSRSHEADELLSLVASARSSFRHAALDHVHCITKLLARKKPEIFSTVSLLIIFYQMLLFLNDMKINNTYVYFVIVIILHPSLEYIFSSRVRTYRRYTRFYSKLE